MRLLLLCIFLVRKTMIRVMTQALPSSVAPRKPSGRIWRKVLTLLALLSVPIVGCVAGHVAAADRVFPLETFEEYPLLAFPGQGEVRGDKDTARMVYRVTEESGNRFLHAHADHQAIQIGLV